MFIQRMSIDGKHRMKKLIMLTTAFAVAMPLMADTETVGGYTWTYRINGNEAEMFKGDGSGFGTCAVSLY